MAPALLGSFFESHWHRTRKPPFIGSVDAALNRWVYPTGGRACQQKGPAPATNLLAPRPPLTCLGFSRLGHARFSLSSEVRDNTQHPLDQHDLAAVMHLVLLHR